ncbi:hypothetical protein KAX35_07385, partial [candidate division WOR-3 bacterium]|nr:hypothetical protein [candidate division WOR-3 bacterium]
MSERLERINKWFAKKAKTIIKLRWIIIAGLIILDIIAIIGIKRIQIDVSNESWFLADDPLVIAREEFEEVFGNNDYVAVLVEVDNIFSPEILK